MSFEVIVHESKQLVDLFTLQCDEHRVMSLPSLEGETTRAPATVRIDRRRLEVRAFGGMFTLDVTGLTTMEIYGSGFAMLSVRDPEHGRRVLDGIARHLELEVAPPRSVQGPLETITVALMAIPDRGGVLVQIKTQPMRFGVWIAPDRFSAELVFGVEEIEHGFDAFAKLWANALCDGKPPRLTRAEDPTLSSDTPWITTTTPLLGIKGLVAWDILFGGEILFAHVGDDGSALLVWEDYTLPPREIELDVGHKNFYPSPDGSWIAMTVSRPDENGDRNNGTAELQLVCVTTGERWSLARSPCAIRFGCMCDAIYWASDSRRFCVLVDRVDGEQYALVYDIESRLFIDVSDISATEAVWEGTQLRVCHSTCDDDDGSDTYFLWTPGDGGLRSTEPPDLESRAPWAGTMLVDLENDARAFHPSTRTWRYLAAPELGRPRWIAPHGRAVVFDDGNGLTIGLASKLTPDLSMPLDWNEPDIRRVAIASALALDIDNANLALGRMDEAA